MRVFTFTLLCLFATLSVAAEGRAQNFELWQTVQQKRCGDITVTLRYSGQPGSETWIVTFEQNDTLIDQTDEIARGSSRERFESEIKNIWTHLEESVANELSTCDIKLGQEVMLETYENITGLQLLGEAIQEATAD
jgi:hypothetical protein